MLLVFAYAAMTIIVGTAISMLFVFFDSKKKK